MERTMQTTRRYKRTRQPRRIVLLWLVCLFAAVSFGVLLAISPAAKALLRSEGGPAPTVAPVEGREMPRASSTRPLSTSGTSTPPAARASPR